MAKTEVLLPLMGEGVNEATISSWLVKEGDKVTKDSPLLEVSTDKVDTEIPAPASGILLKVSAAEGDTGTVDQLLACIGDSTSDLDESAAPAPSPKTAKGIPPATSTQASVAKSTKPQTPSSANAQVKSSPLVRKIAAEKGIDLATVSGTGLHGRITKKDILNHNPTVTTRPTEQLAKVDSPAPQIPAETNDRLTTTFDEDGNELLEGVAVEREPMSRMRQLIAKHMVDSVRISPHVTTVFEIDMHEIVKSRESFKDEFFKAEGFKLTYTPYLLYAAVEAIKKFPIVNTSLDGNDILFKKDINLGCAVALENGLIVPVIKKAGDLSLSGIARRLNDLVVRARNKKLKPDDVQGGTFSVTTPGGYGSLTSNPIINQPQVAILGIGTIVKRPVVYQDMIAIRPQMLASLTFDHRVIDGEGGSKFLACFKENLESFSAKPM